MHEKNGVIRLAMFTPSVMVIKTSKMAGHFLLDTATARNQKIFKCIYKVLFGPFRKYYGLCTSGQPLAKFQRLKLEDFGIPLLTQKFFYLSHEYLTNS